MTGVTNMRITLRFADVRAPDERSIALSQIRAGILAVAGSHSPPLEPMDVLGLAVEALAKQVFNRRIPDGAISVDETLRPLRQALCSVLQAAPEAAQSAGLLPDSQTMTITASDVEGAFAKFIKWAITVLHPSVREFIYFPRHLETKNRIDLVVHQWGAIHESAAHRADPARLRDVLRVELGRTLGEPEVGLEELTRPKLHGWLQFLLMKAGPDARLMKVRAGQLGVNRMCLRATLDGNVGVVKQKSGKVRMSLDAAVRDELDLSRGHKWQLQQSREVDPSAELARRELRDQRDSLDAHRLLQSIADEALDCGDQSSIENLSNCIEALRPVLASHRDQALKAALVFSASRGMRQRGHGGFTKEQVALAYGVTARQLDGRMGRAEELLRAALLRRA